MSQPQWKLIAQLGDADPISYGGYFIYEDRTGVYAPEAEVLIAPDDDETGEWIVYRFSLDRCTYIDGILSDNPYHPELSAWWAQSPDEAKRRPQDTTKLSNLALCTGRTELNYINMFCSEDPRVRAMAYEAIGLYHGWENLDAYPRTFTNRADVEARYAAELTEQE